MDTRLAPWIKGVIASAMTMVIYAVPLGFFIALMLLVVAMEEGGNALTSSVLPLTQAVVLLTEGVGFQAGSIVIGITPLLLTILLIALIRTMCNKTGTSWQSYISGILAWLVINRCMLNGLHVAIDDSSVVVLGKSAIVYTLGFAIAAIPQSRYITLIRTYIRAHVSYAVRHAVLLGIGTALILIGAMLAIGLGTVCAWIILNHQAVNAAFTTMSMQNGSRILMCIMAFAWLPNACLWALSWLFGGGFSIGEVASYSLWAASTKGLPPLPIFALFPQAVTNETIRFAVIAIPLVLGVLVGGIMMLTLQGFHIIPWSNQQDMRALLLRFAYPAGAFCITATVLSLVFSLFFWFSNGSLGTQRLAHVGVDIRQSTNVVARPCTAGLFIAWGAILIIAALTFTIRWLLAHREHNNHTVSSAKAVESQKEEKMNDTPRVVNSSRSQKEKQGDDDEPTVTTGLGVRIP